MSMKEHVHWYLTSNCNVNCVYCFRPKLSGKESKANLLRVAENLARHKVKRVTLTGGEPTLVNGLDEVLEFFSDAGVYTSLHTNGLLLDRARLKALSSIVGDIAIPIDSMNQETQARLKRQDVLPRMLDLAGEIIDAGIKLGVHTVFTSVNYKDLSGIYRFLKRNGFDYWRIYEFNPDLVAKRFASVQGFLETRELGIDGTPEKGGTDSLFAEFLLAGSRFAKFRDKRVQFVSSNYQRNPYIFVDSQGNFYYCFWFAQKRKFAGNLFQEGFRKVERRVSKIWRHSTAENTEAYFDSINSLPLFARRWEGNYFPEEFEEFDRRSERKLVCLAELYRRKILAA